MTRTLRAAPALIALGTLYGPGAGTETGVGTGGGQYWYKSGCENPTLHKARYFEAQAFLRHRPGERGWVFTGEGTVMRSTIKPAQTATDDGMGGVLRAASEVRTSGVLAARVGYDWRYGGVEGGPALTSLYTGENKEALLAPSLRAWAGVPHVAYAWGAVLAGEAQSLNRIVAAGVGHAGPRLRLSLGLSGTAGDSGAGIADAAYRIGDRLWLGLGAEVGFEPQDGFLPLGALLRISFRP